VSSISLHRFSICHAADWAVSGMCQTIRKSLLALGALCSPAAGIVLRGSTEWAPDWAPTWAQTEKAHSNASTDATTECKLPDFATWCTVTPTTGRPFQMAVYRYNDIVSTQICGQGFWEMRDPAVLGTPGTALDIGGNIGYYSFLLPDAGWSVESFEPLPQNLQLMKATACRNPALAKKINIHPVGLGASDDNCVFVSGYDNVGDGWVRCGEEPKRMRAGTEPIPAGYALRGSFPVVRLDDILKKEGAPKKIDFVKLDVEGFECQVMAGGASILKTYRPKNIQSEVWPKMDHCSPTDYLSSFKKANYKVAKARGCAWPDSQLGGGIQDFFMCKQGSFLLQLA